MAAPAGWDLQAGQEPRMARVVQAIPAAQPEALMRAARSAMCLPQAYRLTQSYLQRI